MPEKICWLCYDSSRYDSEKTCKTFLLNEGNQEVLDQGWALEAIVQEKQEPIKTFHTNIDSVKNSETFRIFSA